MKKVIIGLFLIPVCLLSLAQQSYPDHLRCEYLVNPIGIDSKAPRLSWLLKDDRHGAVQNAYRLIVDTDSMAVLLGQGTIWDSQKVNSDKMLVNYMGSALQAFTKYYWSVRVWDKDHVERVSSVASFETGMIHSYNWRGMWISDGHGNKGNDINFKPAGRFRKEFQISKQIKSARAYVAVAGLYELYINGEKVGDQRINPMFTRFDRRNLYVTHDVTSYLQNGANAIGILLGNGWYNHQSITKDWHFEGAPWRDRPAFCMDLRITYDDGTTEIIKTEKDWKTNTGPVIFNSIYTGEHYDARLEESGWDQSGFNDSDWIPVMYRAAPSQNIVSQQLHPIRNVEKIPVKTFTKINDTLYLFDLGRNIAGVTQITVKGESGTKLRIKHGEMLGKDSLIDLSFLDVYHRPVDDTDPFQTDIFILQGKDKETFMAKFNYKGFQYVEVESSKPIHLTGNDLVGWFMHSDVPSIGKMSTSDPIINKIWEATNNSYLSNLFGIPTDCPQREKNGWTGDTNIAIEMGLYNYDGITIYEKWMADHRDEQQPNGVLPAIIPTSGWGYEWGNGPDWTGTIAIVPWNIYLFYGDNQLLADCYDNIKRYVNHITDIAPEGLTTWGLGDWIPHKSTTPVEFTSSVYYYVCTSILAEAAKMFDKQADYGYYSGLAEKIKKAINDKYLNRKTGIYGVGVQTELSMPLYWQIVPEELKDKVAENLAQRVIADNKHVDVGILGSKALLNALSENGYANLAFEVASQRTYPSWGWWIVNGATTLYENWDIYTTRDISMNHIMFGEIGAWFYKALGGIKPDPHKPGFKNIIIQPNFVKGLESASFAFHSPYGEIKSEWKQNKKSIYYKVVIPANTTAELYLPEGMKLKNIQLPDGQKISLRKKDDSYHLISGIYEIEIIRILNITH